jgi:hypothetical protein
MMMGIGNSKFFGGLDDDGNGWLRLESEGGRENF